VVRIDPVNRQLVATISETSRVMVTAGLWELLMTDIRPHHSDWLGHWRVSFFTSAAAASSATRDPSSHVADYDRALNRLILWPDLDEQREEIALEIK
jgi:hypothetical protein